jgi:hypothetical protein
MSGGVGGPSGDGPREDPTPILAAIGDTILLALVERGIGAAAASNAAQAYVNRVSAIYTTARHFGLSGGQKVDIGLPEGNDLRSVIIRHGNDRFGEVWIASTDPVTVGFDSVDGYNNRTFGTTSFE